MMKRLALSLLAPILVHVGFALGQQAVPQGDQLEAAARKFVDQVAAGDFEQAIAGFDDTMSQALSADKLKATWEGIQSQVGKFKGHDAASSERAGGYEIVYLTCQFERMALNAKLVFDGRNKISGLFFLPISKREDPAYANSSELEESEVQVGSDPWRLPGTLTMPKGPGPFPAVVLVHGSGPNDRDETIGPNKIFKDLAWGLATKKIAVLRYDKRTFVHQVAMAAMSDLTVAEESVEDALAAVALLAEHPKIDRQRIFVAGHSLGGYLIPRIAAADSGGSIAGYISLAGSTRPTEDLMLEQLEYLLRLDGSMSPSDQQRLSDLKKQVDAVKALTAQSSDKIVLGVPSAYWIDLRGYSPPDSARSLSKPLLVLQGERDYQVTMEDFANWKNGLKGRDNITFKSFPQLNHLFIAGEGKSHPGEYQIAGNVAEEVINDLADWISSH